MVNDTLTLPSPLPNTGTAISLLFFSIYACPCSSAEKKKESDFAQLYYSTRNRQTFPPPSSKNLATIIYNFFQLKKLNRILLSTHPAVPLQTPQTNSTPSNLPFLPLLHTAQPHTFPPTPSPHSSFLTPHPHDSNLTILTHTSAPIEIEDSPSSALSASSLHSTPNLSLFILRSLDHLRMHSPVF